MRKHYLVWTQGVWLVLLWAVLVSQTAWAQQVPDSQYARLGTTLAITTDGGIVTTETITENGSVHLQKSGSKVVKYSAQGDLLSQTGFLEGGENLGGRIPGYGNEVISVRVIAATTDGGVAVVGSTQLRGGSVPSNLKKRWSSSDLFSGSTYDDLIGTPDGGFLFLSTGGSFGGKTTAHLRKYNADAIVVWTKEIAYPTPNPATPDRSLTKGEAVINTPDGGYLIVGLYIADYDNTTGVPLDDLLRQSLTRNTAWVAKLDGQGNVSWQKLLTDLPIPSGPNELAYNVSVTRMLYASDVTLTADGNGYALVGSGLPPSTRVHSSSTGTIVELNADGSLRRARTIRGESYGESFITNYTGSGGTKYYAVGNTLYGIDPQITLINPAPLPLNDLNLFKIEARRAFHGPDPGRLLAIDVAGDGGLVFASSGNQVVKLVSETSPTPPPPPPPGTLALTQPTYNCQTGAITFNTTGGDGSTITYNAPGVTRSSLTSNTGIVEQELRNDPKPINLSATQNGQSVSYSFDFKAFCAGGPPVNPPTPPVPPVPPVPPIPPVNGALALTQPTYNCQSGAFTFNTSGGNGSSIEYASVGITGWTTNPNQFVDRESRTVNDVKPFTLMARQNGVTVSLVWDLKAACGRARLGVGERLSELSLTLLGNPVGEQATVEVRGAEGQSLRLRLVDLKGRLVESRLVEQAGSIERQVFDLRQAGPGLLLLRVGSGTQTNTVKIVRQ